MHRERKGKRTPSLFETLEPRQLMASINVAFGVGMVPISLVLALFIMMLEILVAFIQAYIFTLLTAIFIGMNAHPAH